MHREYAINPEQICRTYDRFFRIWNDCGFSEGRIVVEFPKKWVKNLMNSDTYKALLPVQKKTITEALAQGKKHALVRHGRASTPQECWLESALEAHASVPFDAILDENNPKNHPDVLHFDSATKMESLWQTRSSIIYRTVGNLGDCAQYLLKCSRQIQFIDPYFCFESKFTDSFHEFFSHLSGQADHLAFIEVHLQFCQYARNRQWVDFESEFKQQVKSKAKYYLPSGAEKLLARLIFYAWENKRTDNGRPNDKTLHERLILTERGGLVFDRGLDANPDDTTNVFMLKDHDLGAYKNRYTQETSPFDLRGVFQASDICK